MKMKLWNCSGKNMEERKREIMELLCLKLMDNDYLPKLVVSMPKRLTEVIQKEGRTTHY
jgi:hypothetical protein